MDTTGSRCLRLGPSGCRLSRTLKAHWPTLRTSSFLSPFTRNTGWGWCDKSSGLRTPGKGLPLYEQRCFHNAASTVPRTRPPAALPLPRGQGGRQQEGAGGWSFPRHRGQGVLRTAQSQQGQGGHVTCTKSTEATRLSCWLLWTWSQDRLRPSEGDLSLRMAAQRSWSCSGHLGEQSVVCSRSVHVFSSLGGQGHVAGSASPEHSPPPPPRPPGARWPAESAPCARAPGAPLSVRVRRRRATCGQARPPTWPHMVGA